MSQVLLHAWSLGQELLNKQITVYDLPRLAADKGFGGVEYLDRLMPSLLPRDWVRLGELQREAGISTSALSICLELEASAQSISWQMARAMELVDLAVFLDLKAVRLSIGGSGPKSLSRILLMTERLRTRAARAEMPLGRLSLMLYRKAINSSLRPKHILPPRVPRDELVRIADILRPLTKRAGDMGIALGIENHFGYTSHAEDLTALCELCGNGLGVTLDLGNLPEGPAPKAGRERLTSDQTDSAPVIGSKNTIAIKACQTLAPHVKHVHFKTHELEPEGEARRLDYSKRLAALKQAGYEGLFSIEYEGAGEGIAGAQAALELCRLLWKSIPPAGAAR